jgi:hypothetical protein
MQITEPQHMHGDPLSTSLTLAATVGDCCGPKVVVQRHFRTRTGSHQLAQV